MIAIRSKMGIRERGKASTIIPVIKAYWPKVNKKPLRRYELLAERVIAAIRAPTP
jgi:hypothetical protein